MLTGYMPQLKVVNFKGKISSIGKIVDVKIISASNFSLNGIQKN
jgi:tRNA A37 methylthiotransferase MiaB